jgi:hypothetical protein
MTCRMGNIAVDCGDAAAQATFWSAVLERPVADGASVWFAAIPGEPAWLFVKVPEPKVAKNRLHVDVVSDDRVVDVARFVALGATHVADHEGWGHRWSVLLDPEGNEFCVAEPAGAAEPAEP